MDSQATEIILFGQSLLQVVKMPMSCPCTNNRSETVVKLHSPSFIGDSYFCTCNTGVQSGPVDNHLCAENRL